MRRIQVRRTGLRLVPCLHLIKILQFSQPMLIYGPCRFGQIPVHLRVANIKGKIIVMNDPGKYRVLRQVIMRPIRHNIDKVQILHVRDLPGRPHARNRAQLDSH